MVSEDLIKKSLHIPKSQFFFLFSSRSFIILTFTLWFKNYFQEFSVCHGCNFKVQFYSYPIVPAPSVEQTFFFFIKLSWDFSKIQMAKYLWIYSCTIYLFCSVYFYGCPNTNTTLPFYCNFLVSLVIKDKVLPILFFFFSI